jgi:hypothetical protein
MPCPSICPGPTAADFLNVSQVDVLSVQHDYGIFGGKAGAYILELLPVLTIPPPVREAGSPLYKAILCPLESRMRRFARSGMRCHSQRRPTRA